MNDNELSNWKTQNYYSTNMIKLTRFCPARSHSPVAVDWALVHLDRRSLRAEQPSWRRLQLGSQSAHTRVGLKCVGPALRVLVHHLQQVADCRLGGRVCPLSNTQAEMVGLLWFFCFELIRISGRVRPPLTSQSLSSATCWRALPSPPSPDKLTAGVWQKSTSQQLINDIT